MKQLLIVLILAFAACRKDKKTPADMPSEITAGSSSSAIRINAINTLVYKSDPSFGTAELYIDLNSDGTNDFRLSNSTGHPAGGLGTTEENYIEPVNSDSYVICDSVYYGSFRNSATDSLVSRDTIRALYPKVFAAGDTIRISGKWRQGKLIISDFQSPWTITATGSTYYMAGFWKKTDQKYVAVRYKNVLGWIKIGLNQTGLKIYESACCKVN